MSKVDIAGEYLIDEDIHDIYVKHVSNIKGFYRVLRAIDSGGGQTTDVNGVLKALDKAGYRISCK